STSRCRAAEEHHLEPQVLDPAQVRDDTRHRHPATTRVHRSGYGTAVLAAPAPVMAAWAALVMTPTASRSLRPCSAHRECQVQNEMACPMTARIRRRGPAPPPNGSVSRPQ